MLTLGVVLTLGSPLPVAAGQVSEPGSLRADDELETINLAEAEAEAKAMFNRGALREAAQAFDVLWAREQTPIFLYFAAVAWASSDDDTRAILRWRHYLAEANGTENPETARTHEYLREAYKRTTLLSLAVRPTGALVGDSWIELVRLPEIGEDGVIRVSLADARADDNAKGLELFLSPGTWRLTVIRPHPGYDNSSVEFDVTADTGSLQRSLQLSPREGDLVVTVAPARSSQRPFLLVLDDAAELEPRRDVTISSDEATKVRLRRGTWHYRVEDRDAGWEESGDIELDGAETSLSIGGGHRTGPLTTRGHEGAVVRRRRLAIGLGVGSAALGTAGLGLIVPTSLMLRKRLVSDVPRGLRRLIRQEACQSEYADGVPFPSRLTSGGWLGLIDLHRECVVSRSLILQPVGGALLGASLGLAVNAAVVRTRASRKFLSIPAVTGLVAGTAGLLLFSAPRKRILEDLKEESGDIETDVTVSAQTITAGKKLSTAAGLMGLGGGLVVGAGIALLTLRRRTPRKTSKNRPARLSPMSGGCSLRIDF